MRSAVALGVVLALALGACTSGGRDAASGTVTGSPSSGITQSRAGTGSASPNPGVDGAIPQVSAAEIPDAAALAHAAQGLPDDPAAAASALVDRMFGDDPALAVAATGELLRRAGLPLGSGKGPMVAMPDDLVVTNAQIGVALLPAMTGQVLGGTAFDLDQVQALLAHLGVPDAFTDAQLISMIAEWGKGQGDSVESRYAGAAERALAAKHRQLFAATDVPDAATMTALKNKPESLPLDVYQRLINYPTQITLDPVQVLLLVSHVAGAVTDSPVVEQLPPTAERTAGSTETPHPFRRETTGPCSVVQTPLDTEGGKIVKGTLKQQLQDALKAAAKTRISEEAATLVEKGFGGYDQLTDVLSYLAFTMALQFTVKPSTSTTHFLHDEPAHANDVTFLAHAYNVPLVPPEYVDCFSIAGIDIPTAKDLKDMQVIWSLPNGRVGLKPAVVGGRQFDVPILLDKHGNSTVQTTPRRESHPPAGGDDRPQSTVIQTVKAELDKNYLELHVSDLVLLLFGSLAGAAVSVAYKVIVAMIKEGGLPAKTIEYPVTYHGSNVYHIFGDAMLSILFYADVPLKADLYSCNGAEGPWQGSISVGGAAGPILRLAGDLAGYDGPTTGPDITVPANFSLNPQTAQLQTFTFGDKYGLVVQLDEAAVDASLQTKSGTGKVAERMQRIGWASWTLGGQDVRVVAGLIGGFLSQSLDLPVEAVPGDLRCSGTAVYQNEFD
jgi:hypothetical protein